MGFVIAALEKMKVRQAAEGIQVIDVGLLYFENTKHRIRLLPVVMLGGRTEGGCCQRDDEQTGYGGVFHFKIYFQVMPSFFIREVRVLGFMPRASAAPPLPETRPLAWSRAAMISILPMSPLGDWSG